MAPRGSLFAACSTRSDRWNKVVPEESACCQSPGRTHPMQRITRDQARKYAFDWEDEPLLRVQPGESFEIETVDASTRYFKTENDKARPSRGPGFNKSPPLANPIG